ncbi:MAG: nickel pincer cofactor biosynthesis protein LarB [Candidatus Altiarchaeales archaeon]|nr:MAG: nickel pincer cofactor biosynthesis protein LarB [Candidatus Altiarchaeales archaeon]
MRIKHDKYREERCGIPEVVYGKEKPVEDLLEITERFLEDSKRVIITRIDKDKVKKITRSIDSRRFRVIHNEGGNVLIIKERGFSTERIGKIGIMTAGTSDIPVAEEARAIAEELGCEVICEYDVGIAGIHRVFSAVEKMKKASVLIVIAGMEGALPSVVAGLIPTPVIAVPTSVGYGTGTNGKAALFTMLNSCTPLAVMNIDNGYGAAALAYKILRAKNR